MNDTITVKPDTIFLEDLLDDVAQGYYKIPIFQREFVWNSSQILNLFDSILKGYPIGSLLFWKTKTEFETRDEVGQYIIQKKDYDFKYVLDGFQRISALFGVLINPKNFNEAKNMERSNDFSIFFDVKENNFISIRRRKSPSIFTVQLYKIYDIRELFIYFKELEKELDEGRILPLEKDKFIDRARSLHDILHKYKLPFVEIKGGDIKSAIEIFSRANSMGTEISEDYILSARSYGDTQFKLVDSISNFINSLNHYNFEDLKRDTILNCISNAKGKIYFDVKTEELLTPDLENFTNSVFIHIEKAVSFLYKKLFIIDIRLLPYPSQLVFISEYFRLNPNPTPQELQSLANWFWITTYSNFFTIYSISQQRSAYQYFKEFIEGENNNGIYKVDSDMIFTSAKYPEKLNFTSVRNKALKLFYLKSILDDQDIPDMEGIKEFFIFSKKDRKPANIILRISSEFDKKEEMKQLDFFINNSPINVLKKHFITQEMVDLFNKDEIESFISSREAFLKDKERQFVENLQIKYTD